MAEPMEVEKPEERAQPILLLEEDDEFEEFEKDGERHVDWNEGAQEGPVETKEWEEDWDDDVEEADFAQELRNELLKVK